MVDVAGRLLLHVRLSSIACYNFCHAQLLHQGAEEEQNFFIHSQL